MFVFIAILIGFIAFFGIADWYVSQPGIQLVEMEEEASELAQIEEETPKSVEMEEEAPEPLEIEEETPKPSLTGELIMLTEWSIDPNDSTKDGTLFLNLEVDSDSWQRFSEVDAIVFFDTKMNELGRVNKKDFELNPDNTFDYVRVTLPPNVVAYIEKKDETAMLIQLQGKWGVYAKRRYTIVSTEAEWQRILSTGNSYKALGVEIVYPNDGTYVVKADLPGGWFAITQEYPGNGFSVEKAVNASLYPEPTSTKTINGVSYKIFYRDGLGDGYGYIREYNGSTYIFESGWGPTNALFEAMMNTVKFE